MKKTTKQLNILRITFCLLALMCAGLNYANAQFYTDDDNDGYGRLPVAASGPTNADDCDDNDASIHPGGTEIANNLDDDCDGLVDEGLMTVNAGSDANGLFGYTAGQDISRTASVSNGFPPYTYSWTMDRALICNFFNSAGDELFYGGTCTDNICPGSGSPSNAPVCNAGTINCRLLANAQVCVTVTDVQGSTASDCFVIFAEDARCHQGSNTKINVCHSTGSQSNPWVQICISENALPAHLSHNSGDYVGTCDARQAANSVVAVNGFSITPNPSSGQFTIRYNSGVNAVVKINVTNLVGQSVYTETISDYAGHMDKQMDFGFLKSGVYMLSLTDGSNLVNQKIVIE